MRERGSALANRGRGFLFRHRSTWLIALAGAVLLSGVGAFQTDHAVAGVRYGYWFAVMLTGAVISALVWERFDARGTLSARPLAKAAVLALVAAALTTPVVWVMAAWALEGSWHVTRMAHLFPQVLLVSTAFVTLQLFARSREMPALSEPAMSEASGPALLQRLPPNLRGAKLHALETEDHYLRLHTDLGSALILMSLSDATAELKGLDGARTHRSWWVAKEAVVSASRGRGRATLNLKDGLKAPVSRTYSPALREAGWF